MEVLSLYIAEFRALHVNKTGGKIAPHKPILLLSIIDLVESGHIFCNRVYLDDTLQCKFKQTWAQYVDKDSCFRRSIAYPFFHMGNDKFWRLIPSYGHKEKSEYTSIKSIQDNFECAMIDQDLFDVLQDPSARAQLRVELIKHYL